jgi:hypothetical protein
MDMSAQLHNPILEKEHSVPTGEEGHRKDLDVVANSFDNNKKYYKLLSHHVSLVWPSLACHICMVAM